MAALTQLQEEPVQPFRHCHLGMGTRGVREQLRGGFAQATKSSGIPRWNVGWGRASGVWEGLEVPGKAEARGAGGERG